MTISAQSVENTLRFHPQLCIHCGMCLEVCPHGVFIDSLRQVLLAHPESCMECGACQMNCPTGAIQVDSGTGCAEAMIRGALKRANPFLKKKPSALQAPDCGET